MLTLSSLLLRMANDPIYWALALSGGILAVVNLISLPVFAWGYFFKQPSDTTAFFDLFTHWPAEAGIRQLRRLPKVFWELSIFVVPHWEPSFVFREEARAAGDFKEREVPSEVPKELSCRRRY